MLSGAVLLGHAQNLSDTVLLEQVVVTATDLYRFHPGGRHQVIETDTIPLTMTQAIESKLPVYFIQYGAPGQLASINLRGLGASRTNLRWQGMDINTFTLGQSDFSQFSVGSGDILEIQFGGGGALFGNGALGGTVDLRSNLDYNQGQSAAVNTMIGSYGTFGTFINYRYSNHNISSSTRIFRNQAENNFEFTNQAKRQRQQNAAYLLYGFVQDLEYQLNAENRISFSFWYNHHFREIQPNINNPNGDEVIKNRNSRAVLSYQLNKKTWFGQVKAGFTDDYQLYNRRDQIRLYRWFGSFDTEWNGLQNLILRFGGNVNYLNPQVHSYDDQTSETRSELYTGLVWNRVKNLDLGLSVRTPMVNGSFKTVSPLLSASYMVYKSIGAEVNADIQVSRSYRLPTMNDLYWVPGGNTELQPEQSNSLETGISLSWRQSKVDFRTSLRGFRHEVENWIIWLPGGSEQNGEGEIISFWYPENIREVLATGVEYQQTVQWNVPISGLTTRLDIQGTYNKSVNKKTLSPVDRSKGKQLPYTPKHVFNATWSNNYKQWNLNINTQYRSKRYLEANNELTPLPDYTLWNFALGRKGKLGSLQWMLQLGVNNALNEDYQTYENRAMPGRNYHLNLNIHFN